MSDARNLPVQEKKELQTKEEQTAPARYYVPTTDIFETQDELTVVLEMPGVEKKDIIVGLENDKLRIEGQSTSRSMRGSTHSTRSTMSAIMPGHSRCRARSTRKGSARRSRTAC